MAATTSPDPVRRVFVGTVVHSLGLANGLEFLAPGAVGVTAAGVIAFCRPLPDAGLPRDRLHCLEPFEIVRALAPLREIWAFEDSAVEFLRPGQFLVPGFVDTHIHAPQYVFSGTGLDLPLLEWLNKYTFPREAKFADASYARSAYRRAVSRSLNNGTTTACYYSTIHLEASRILVDVVLELGQRAFIGKVNMDRNSPDYYVESTEASYRETVEFADYVAAKQTPLVTPVLTPRFAPSCTPELMTRLGELARARNLPIQSHISENHGEIEWVGQLFPDSPSYAAVYDRFGLLTARTVMAHGIHLTTAERALLRARGAAVSHCPNSNFALESGVLNVRRMLDEGLKVGLGTDVAGGYHPSILDAFRQAVTASKVTAARSREERRAHDALTAAAAAANSGTPGPESPRPSPPPVYPALSTAEAFYLATLGGAEVMGLERAVGNFAPGKDFDALLVDVGEDVVAAEAVAATVAATAAPPHPVDVFPHDSVETQFEKFLYLGDDRNIVRIFVRGREVKGAAT